MSKAEAMKAKLAKLKERRAEARKLNSEETAEEERRSKLPDNFEARKARAEYEESVEKAKKEAKAAGLDYERLKAKKTTALEADRKDRRKRKKNEDPGFADYAQAQHRQYTRLTKALKPDMKAYSKSAKEWGDDDVTADTLAYGQHDAVSKAGLDRMAADLEAQIEKRAKFSRRRAHHHDADISYINERNMQFNKKLDRFYGKYTQEIRENLERGTAI
mmetsp:Transcript_22558/g.58895  ORF Transcript_22558/g.58895 Transcript_22558/m.58895 type:complete len:218 (-) Transcript_22558:152-805(-)